MEGFREEEWQERKLESNAAMVCVAGRGGNVRSMGVQVALVPWVLMMVNVQV